MLLVYFFWLVSQPFFFNSAIVCWKWQLLYLDVSELQFDHLCRFRWQQRLNKVNKDIRRKIREVTGIPPFLCTLLPSAFIQETTKMQTVDLEEVPVCWVSYSSEFSTVWICVQRIIMQGHFRTKRELTILQIFNGTISKLIKLWLQKSITIVL